MKWENENFSLTLNFASLGKFYFYSPALDYTADAFNIIWDFDLTRQVFRKGPTCSESQVQKYEQRESLAQLRYTVDTWINQKLSGIDYTAK